MDQEIFMSKPIRILFVDDEPNILQGIRRMLRKHQESYEPHFAASGQEALAILDRQPMDIIVSDMRMPGMDGTTLLKHVYRTHPGTVRVALSGQSDTSVSLKASMLVHQFLAKPCSHADLLKVIEQCRCIREMILQPKLRQVIASMKTIPSLPSLYMRLTSMLEDPNTSVEEIGHVIESDVGMSAKVMQLVNSAYFGLSSHVSSPSHAASLLGINTLRSLILSVHIFERFSPAHLPSSWSEWLWKHSLSAGAAARMLLKHVSSDRQLLDYGYISGILHDIGIILLAQNYQREYHQVLKSAVLKRLHIFQAEQRAFGTTHMDVGAYLLSIWGFCPEIVEAVRYHHIPSSAPEDASHALTMVHLAEHFETSIRGSWKQTIPSQLDVEYINRVNFSSNMETWFNEVQQLLAGVSENE